MQLQFSLVLLQSCLYNTNKICMHMLYIPSSRLCFFFIYRNCCKSSRYINILCIMYTIQQHVVETRFIYVKNEKKNNKNATFWVCILYNI